MSQLEQSKISGARHTMCLRRSTRKETRPKRILLNTHRLKNLTINFETQYHRISKRLVEEGNHRIHHLTCHSLSQLPPKKVIYQTTPPFLAQFLLPLTPLDSRFLERFQHQKHSSPLLYSQHYHRNRSISRATKLRSSDHLFVPSCRHGKLDASCCAFVRAIAVFP